jgi:hypothetical protein
MNEYNFYLSFILQNANFLKGVQDIRHVMLRHYKSCDVYQRIVTGIYIYKIVKEEKIDLLGKGPCEGLLPALEKSGLAITLNRVHWGPFI